MTALVVLIVLVTTLWVALDAHALGVERGVLGSSLADFGVLGWALGCFLLWIFVFPAYLVQRPRYVALADRAADDIVRARRGPAVSRVSAASTVGQLVELSRLRDAGAVSAEEFGRLKAELLPAEGAGAAPSTAVFAGREAGRRNVTIGALVAVLLVVAVVGVGMTRAINRQEEAQQLLETRLSECLDAAQAAGFASADELRAEAECYDAAAGS